jgi:tetratricopeptide (TPR) repeat protein
VFALVHALHVALTRGMGEAKRLLDAAIARAVVLGDVVAVEFLCGGGATVAAALGDTETALDWGNRAVPTAEKLGAAVLSIDALAGLGAAKISNGDWNEGIDALERVLGLVNASGVGREFKVIALAWLAPGYLARGEPARARDVALEALQLSREHHTPHYMGQAEVFLARARLALGGEQEAEAVRAGLARAEALGPSAVVPHVREAEAELAGILGDGATREEKLREAHRLFTEMGAPKDAERLAHRR